MDEKGTMQATAKKAGRGHFLCEKAPALVMTVGAYLISVAFPLVGAVAVGLLVFVLPPFDRDSWEGFVVAISAFLLVWMHKRWFAPDFEGSVRISVPMGDILRWSLPFWVCMGCAVLVDAFARGEFYFHMTLSMAALCTSAGFFEEAVYRAFIIPIGMRYLTGENRIWWTMGISAGMFGLAHMANILAGADLGITISQVISCIPLGLYAAALTLRSGSFLPAAVLHMMLDIIAMGTTPGIGDGIMRGAVDWSTIVNIALEYALLATFGIWLAKTYKTEILALWEKKWGMAPEETT